MQACHAHDCPLVYCPPAACSSVEWKSSVNAAAIPYGLMLRTWVHGTEATMKLYRSPVDPKGKWQKLEEDW